LLAAFTVALSGPLTRALVAKSFAGASVFVMFGAFIELFRLTANLLTVSAHSELRTGALIKPYALGATFTSLAVYAACGSPSHDLLVPTALVSGGLVTLVAMKFASDRLVPLKLDRGLLLKTLGLAAPFLLFLTIPASASLIQTAGVLAAAGAYAAFSVYFATFRLYSDVLEPARKVEGGPTVCVCIPTYNSTSTLKDTLDSVLGQTYRNIRVFVVDNASTDGTAELAESYAQKDSRVRVFRNAENIGGEGNFSRCIQLAEGDYTAIYHADDVYEPEIVEKSVAFLEEHRIAGAVFTQAREIDGSGNPGAVRRLPRILSTGEVFDFDDVFRAVLKRGNFLVFPSAMVRTTIYKGEIQAWDAARFKTSADLDVWLRILQNHGIGILREPLIRYRVSEDSYSYRLMKTKDKRHDLFLVLDSYMFGSAADLVGEAERWDYRFLLLKDQINIAINKVIRGEGEAARVELEPLFFRGTLLRALTSTWRLRLVAIGLATYTLSFLSFGLVRELLAAVRYGKKEWAAL
jgi:glycosyltransferase involved in cell wall biosynthesis